MLRGKRVVVLGGSAGTGRAVAEKAASEGAEVVIASSNSARVKDATDAIAGCEGHVADLRSAAAVNALFERLGTLDHLVYTAGEGLLVSPLRDMDLEQARRFFEIRYWGALAAVKAASPRISPGGSVVLTSGTAGQRPHAGFAVIGGLCGAMEALTRALAVELAPLRVNVVTPGLVKTPLWDPFPEEAKRQLFADAARTLPTRHVATPDEIAEHYLGFMKGRYVTGQSLVVDGGGVLV